MRLCSSLAMSLTAILMTATVFADSIESCREIENDLDRLACFDRVSGRTPISSGPESKGAWTISTRTSELKDTTDVFMRVESNDSVSCRFGNRDKITLMIRCMENTTAVIFITPGCHMTSSDYNDYGHVEYRIDSRKAKKARMEESTNNRSLGLWSGSRAIPFAKEMFGAQSLIARITPYNENPFTVTFNISGLEEAIKPLRTSCNW